MESWEIVDREYNVASIIDFINSTERLSIVIIKAPTGTGKYSVFRKICNNLNSNYTIIEPTSLCINEDTQKIRGYFFHNIVISLSNYYNDKNNIDKKFKKYTFEYFAKKQKDIKIKYAEENLKLLSENGISKNSVFSVALNTARRIFGSPLNNLDVDTKKEFMLSLGKEYVKNILAQSKIVLVLRNAQFIDIESIRGLLELAIDNNMQSVIFFSYDIDADNSYSKYKFFADYIKLYDNVLEMDLKPLNFNNTMEILEKNVSKDIKKYKPLLFDLYNECNIININYILDRAFELANKNDHYDYRILTISDKLKLLSNTESFILTIIDILGDGISHDIIIKLFNKAFPEESNSILFISFDLLNDKHLIANTDDDYLFYNKFIKKEWNDYILNCSSYNNGILVAAKFCLDYCREKINDQASCDQPLIEKYVLILIKIFTKYITVNFYYLLECIDLISNKLNAPEDIWRCLEKMIDCIRKDKEKYLDVYFSIIDLCMDMELYHEAFIIWNDIEKIALSNEDHVYDKAYFLMCKIYYLNDKYKDLIDLLNSKISNTQNSSSLMYYYIFLIITYRACNKYSEIKAIVERIRCEKNRFIKTIQYGYFLRISEVYKTRIEAIPDVEASVDFFNNLKMYNQKAKSLISLSFLYSISGQLELAIEALNEAKSIFGNKFNNILCNNEAVIYMLNGIFRDPTESLLRLASLTSNGNFSCASVYNNQMILYYELNQKSDLIATIKLTEMALEKIIDKHLIAVISYNLYLVTKSFDTSKSQKYLKKAKQYCDHDMVLKKRLNNIPSSNKVEHFLLGKPWHIVMLSFWEIDYLEDY